MFNEEAEQSLDEFIEEATEARREEAIIFYEGCTIVTAPTGPPPEYLTVEVDTINDYNVMWRGVPVMPAVGDEVIVWENPLSHRREIWGGSGTSGVSGGASWCQVVVVAKCGGDFDDITDAIAWINALAAGPLATRLFVLYVLAGNWIEGAIITIPSFVTLRGMGDGTSIEMGAFDLIMSDDSNLFNVKITFAASGTLHVGSKDRVIIEHIHGTQTSNDEVLYVYGTSSDVECKDCWFESTGNRSVTLRDSAVVRFDNCRMKADGGSAYPLLLANTADATTLWCQITGNTPVGMFDTSVWHHIACQFDPDACVLTANEDPMVTGKANFDDIVYFENGFNLDGLTTQNIITIPDAVADALEIVDSITDDEYLGFRTSAQQEVVINEDGVDIDFRVEAVGIANALMIEGSSGHIAVNKLINAAHRLSLQHTVIDMPASQRAIFSQVTATFTANNARTTAGYEGGTLIDVNVGFAATGEHRGVLGIATLDTAHAGAADKLIAVDSYAGTQGASAGTLTYLIALRAGFGGVANTTVIGDTCGLYVKNPLNLGWTLTTVTGIFIENIMRGGTNYAIYSAGGNSYHLGRFAIGGTVGALAQLHVDQSAAGGGIPVALFDQADLSEEFFEFTTTVGAGNPIDPAGIGAYYGKARVMVTGVGYKVLALYEET